MARSRLALVAIVGNYEGPWALVDGFERARVEVRGLGEGEGVRIEFEPRVTGPNTRSGTMALNSGSNAVSMENWTRYRVVKASDVPLHQQVGSPTTVEIFLGG